MTEKFDFECPECRSKIRVSLDDIAKRRTVRCRNGHAGKLHDRGGSVRGLNKAIRDLGAK